MELLEKFSADQNEKAFTSDKALYIKEGHHLRKAIEIMRRPAYGGIYGKNKN